MGSIVMEEEKSGKKGGWVRVLIEYGSWFMVVVIIMVMIVISIGVRGRVLIYLPCLFYLFDAYLNPYPTSYVFNSP